MGIGHRGLSLCLSRRAFAPPGSRHSRWSRFRGSRQDSHFLSRLTLLTFTVLVEPSRWLYDSVSVLMFHLIV